LARRGSIKCVVGQPSPDGMTALLDAPVAVNAVAARCLNLV
jgi:hypothetical protein